MMQSLAKTGDRLLALVVPEHDAAADECYTEKRCGPYACNPGMMDYKVRQRKRTVCRRSGAGYWRSTNYCCYIRR